MPTSTTTKPTTPRSAVSLKQYLNIRRLLEMRQSLHDLTRLSLVVRDSQGNILEADPQETRSVYADNAISQPAQEAFSDAIEGGYVAPISIDGTMMGSISIEAESDTAFELAVEKIDALAREHDLPAPQRDLLRNVLEQALNVNRDAANELFFLWVNGIIRACAQEHELRHRVEELTALQRFSRVLSGQHDLQVVLDSAAKSIAEVMKVRATSIRLLTDDGSELEMRAGHNLSDEYLTKGPTLIEQSELAKQSLEGKIVFIADMATDPRIVYRDAAKREGLVSMLSAPVRYQDRTSGVIRLYSDEPRTFSTFEVRLLRSVAELVATAVENARLNTDRERSHEMRHQVELARDVQRRMLPASMPRVPGLDIAARYIPSYDLSGDFFDFLKLSGHLGVTVGDVVGHGIAASLLMSSVRASLRAYAQDLYDIDEVIVRVNQALYSDTKLNEFATLFYGVIDPETLRLTYCSAGHEPPLLLRDGEVELLTEGGMVVGIDPDQQYTNSIVQLKPGDMLLIHTDGLTEAFNFDREKFGRERVIEAFRASTQFGSEAALNHILWQMRCFTGLRSPDDDTTAVLIRVTE